MELDFTPDPDLGEGEPSPGEIKHRAELLLLLLGYYQFIERELGSDGNIDTIINNIESELAVIISQSLIILETITRQYDTGYNEALEIINEVLENTDLSPLIEGGYQPRLDALNTQQLYNLQSIYNEILDAVKRNLYFNEVSAYYPEIIDGTGNRNWLIGIFQNAINRLDLTGLWGYNEAWRSGFLEAATVAFGISLLKTEVYWISMKDKKVCLFCIKAEANSPYPPKRVPMEHLNGRCRLKLVVTLI